MSYITKKDLENWFTYHLPKPGQQEKYVAIRDKAKEFAELIVLLAPDCIDTTVAIRHLRETVMIVNQAIACYS